MVAEDLGHGDGAPAALVVAAGGHRREQHERGGAREDDRDDVDGVEPAEVGGERRHERPQEHADAVRPAEQRHRPAAERGRHDLADVREPRELPRRPAAALDERERREDDLGRRQRPPDEREDHGERRCADRRPLAEARQRPAGGDVEDEDADAAQGDDQPGDRRRGPEVAGGERDDGDEPAVADEEQDRRQVDRHAERAQRDRSLLRHPGRLPHAGRQALRGEGPGHGPGQPQGDRRRRRAPRARRPRRDVPVAARLEPRRRAPGRHHRGLREPGGGRSAARSPTPRAT